MAHRAPLFGGQARGKKFSVTGISIYRVTNGKILEHWGEMGFLGVLKQLGLAPQP